MKYINNVIHTENKIDLNNFIYTEIYAFSDAIPEVNGTFVNMAAGSSIEILIKSISLTPNVYLIGKGRINSPSIINTGKFKPFTFLIKSDNAGSSDNNQFTIPINKNYGYSYTIDTSDGQKYANVTDNKTITFPSAGTYSIEISSNFPSIYFNNEGDKDKLIDITQWGEIEWLSMVNSFYGCANLTNITAIDVPILTRFKSHPIKYDNTFYDSNIRGFYQTFMNCTNLTNINFIYSWEISQVRVFTAMFRGCNSVNDWEGIINWKFGEFSELHFLFFLSSFDDTAMTYVSNWDVSNVVSFTGTFFGTTITSVTPITNWDVSNVESFSAMFYLTQLTSLIPLTNWDISSVTDLSFMFYGTQLLSLEGLENWDTSNVTDLSFMFYETLITSLIPITNWDVSNATDLSFMFYGTQLLSLEGLEIWDTSNVTDISQFIYGTEVTSLIPLTNWDTSSVTRMGQLFRNLQITSLEGVENWDTSSVTYMEVLIVETPLLTSLIPLTNWDVSNVTELSFSFNDLIEWFRFLKIVVVLMVILVIGMLVT